MQYVVRFVKVLCSRVVECTIVRSRLKVNEERTRESNISQCGCWFEGGQCVDSGHYVLQTTPPATARPTGPGTKKETTHDPRGSLGSCVVSIFVPGPVGLVVAGGMGAGG